MVPSEGSISASVPRVALAAERTLLAWIRTGLALMGFGFVVERFGLFLQMAAHQSLSASPRSFSLGVGVLLLLLGAAAALVSARQFLQVLRNLDPEVVPPGYWTGVGAGLNVIIAIIAVSFALRFLFPDQ